MKEADVTLHCMVRDEFPTVVFALLSTLPYVKQAIVVDTGSTDGTREWLEVIQNKYPDKVNLKFRDNVPDSSGWRFRHYITPNRHLTHIRGEMIDETRTKFFWILDGDEVYRDITCRQIVRLFRNWPSGIKVMYIPLLWFVKDINTLGCFDPPSYRLTGRLFTTQGVKMHGTFPGEMHMGLDGQDLGPGSALTLRVPDIEPYHHYEMLMKPLRRVTTGTVAYNGPQPEVFYKYGIWPKKENPSETQNFSRNPDYGMGEDRVDATFGRRVLAR